MSNKEELIKALEQLSPERQKEVLDLLRKHIVAEPSEEMQAAVRTVFQLFCKEDHSTFTTFGEEETEDNPWSQYCFAHRYWLEVTVDMMKSCGIETAEEMIKCLALMLEVINSTDKVKRKNEKAFGLYIYYISQEATNIEHLRSPEYWSEEKQNESYDNVQGEGTEV